VAELCESLSASNSTLDPILREMEKQGSIVREHGRGIFVSPAYTEQRRAFDVLKTLAQIGNRQLLSVAEAAFQRATTAPASSRPFQPFALLTVKD
jgi:DNA-binding GntR family transcriptional regulator